MLLSASLRALAARLFFPQARRARRGNPQLLLLALLVPAPAMGAGVYAFADESGAVVLRDSAGEAGWRLLFAVEDAGARTMPAPLPAGACHFLRGKVPDWHGEIEGAAAGASLDPDLVKAVIWAESRCNPRAVSARGARGLMQLMPATARQYGVTDALDPVQNMGAGARYLRDLMTLFAGNLELALAAYNAGPRSVVDARMRIPPFRETLAYVPAVLERLRVLRKR